MDRYDADADADADADGDAALRSPLSARWASAGTAPSSTSASAPPAARLAPGSIRSLILEKEKELHDINEYRIRTLEALLRDKESAAAASKQRLAKLQEDFKYNLKLLEGRDEELALYDANFAALQSALRERDAEKSELQAQLAQLAAERAQTQQQAREQEAESQQKLKDARAQLEGARWRHDDELRALQEAQEAARRQLERQLREREDDADAQRREAAAAFDELLRTREAEHKAALDELQTAVRTLELQGKAAAREADARSSRADELRRKLERAQDAAAASEKQVKALEWQLADERGAAATRVHELEAEAAALKEAKQALLDEYEGKMAELLQSLHAVERAFVQQKDKLEDELQQAVKRKEHEAQAAAAVLESKLSSATAKLREAEERADRLEAELKQAAWERDDLAADKQREVERLQGELQDAEDAQRAAAAELKQQLWALEREAAALREKLADAAAHLQMHKEKDKLQRQELLDAVDKQEDLRREALATGLRWENKLQEEKQALEARGDLRARELQQAADRAVMERQATEQRLAHAESELQRLRSELRALKADARMTAAFGAAAPPSLSRPSPGVAEELKPSPAPPSPLWSDDQGAISPGVSVSPLLMTDSPVGMPTTARGSSGRYVDGSGFRLDAARASDVQAENAKLREVIRQMKDAILQQAQGQSGGSKSSNGSSSSKASLTALQLEQSEQRRADLERQLQALQHEQSTGAGDAKAVARELLEAQRGLEAKDKQVRELEAEMERLKTDVGAAAALKSAHAALETQLGDLKRALAAANSDIDRLVRERAQLMERSNQLRADLRRLSTKPSGEALPSEAFAGKKDYENLVAELSRSLEEARVHNKTLKKELRRMAKLLAQHERRGDGGGGATERTASPSSSLDGDVRPHRHASTLSMMQTLGTSPPAGRRSTATTRSSTSSRSASLATGSELDAELLTLARHKRPSAGESMALRRSANERTPGPSDGRDRRRRDAPPSIPEHGDDGLQEEKDTVGEHLPPPPPPPSGALSSLFGRGQGGGGGSDGGLLTRDPPAPARTDSGVSDARLRLQQAKEMLLLSGSKAAAARASVGVVARSSDRETRSQRDAIHKMRELQSKRAEMASERKKVRNYSLASNT